MKGKYPSKPSVPFPRRNHCTSALYIYLPSRDSLGMHEDTCVCIKTIYKYTNCIVLVCSFFPIYQRILQFIPHRYIKRLFLHSFERVLLSFNAGIWGCQLNFISSNSFHLKNPCLKFKLKREHSASKKYLAWRRIFHFYLCDIEEGTQLSHLHETDPTYLADVARLAGCLANVRSLFQSREEAVKVETAVLGSLYIQCNHITKFCQ